MGLKQEWRCWYDEPLEGKVECRICRFQFAYKAERCFSHLGHDTLRNPGVSRCKVASAHVLSMFRESNGRNIPQRGAERVPVARECSVATGGPTTLPPTPSSPPADSCGGSRNEEPSIRASTESQRVSQCSGGSRPLQQSSIQTGFALQERALVDQAWASFFYEQSIPFAAARSKTFKQAVSATANLRKPYFPPSYHDLRKRLLDQKKKDVQSRLGKLLDPQVESFGCTISIDGWSNVQNRPLMNVMKVCPAGEEFIGSMDASGETKNATYVAEMLGKYIEAAGPENVVQICTDNAPVMKSAADMLIRKWPHLFFQGCAAHVLNLLLGDWGKAKWVKDVIDDVREIVKFVKNRHMPLAIFRDHERSLSLLSPGATRFATSYIMVERVVKVKRGLQQMVIDPRWDVYVSELRTIKDRETKQKARELKRLINDDRLWTSCNNFIHIVWPVVLALREFDGKEPRTDKAYKVMKNLEKHVLHLKDAPFNLPTPLCDALHRQFMTRWGMMRTDLHHAGALLNPRLVDDKELRMDTDAQAGLNRVFLKLARPEDLTGLLNEFHAYFYKLPPYEEAWNVQKYNGAPHLWWHMVGVTVGKLLPPIARRVLAQVVSSSSCERNWSSYSFVHSKSRNRLHAKRAEDLVYVYTNSKILDGKPEKNNTAEEEWYRQNQRAEDSDSDGPGNSDDHAMDDPAENVEATPEMGWEDEEELRERNAYYDADQYELENWRDQNLPHTPVRERREDSSEDWDDVSHGEGDACGEEIEHMSRFMDGTGRLNSENILGGGRIETEPRGVEDDEVNSPPIRDPISSGRCRTQSPTVISDVRGGRALHTDENPVHGHEGNEGFCNIQDARLEPQEFLEVHNGGVAHDLPVQPPARTVAPFAHARASVASTEASGRRALHTPLTGLYTDDSSDDNMTLEAQLLRKRRIAENRTLANEPSRLREVIRLEDRTPRALEVIAPGSNRPLPQVAPLRRMQTNNPDEMRAFQTVQEFNPGRTPTPVPPFVDPNALPNRTSRRSRPLPTSLGVATTAGEFRPPRTSEPITVEGPGPSQKSSRRKKRRTTTPKRTRAANAGNEEAQGRPRKQARATQEEVEDGSSTDSTNTENATSHEGDDGTSGAEVPNDSTYEP